MASSLRRRDAIIRKHEEFLRSKKLGAIYIQPDTTPNAFKTQSVFTPRHVSFNSRSSLFMSQMVDKEYMSQRQFRATRASRDALKRQNSAAMVRPRTQELYKDAARRRRALSKKRRQKPEGLTLKPSIYAGRRPSSAPAGQTCYDRLYANTAYNRPARKWSKDDEKQYLRNFLTKKVKNKNFVPRVGRLGVPLRKRPSSTNLKFNDVDMRHSKLPELYLSVKGRTMLPRYFLDKY
jgi:hypothetical protein